MPESFKVEMMLTLQHNPKNIQISTCSMAVDMLVNVKEKVYHTVRVKRVHRFSPCALLCMDAWNAFSIRSCGK